MFRSLALNHSRAHLQLMRSIISINDACKYVKLCGCFFVCVFFWGGGGLYTLATAKIDWLAFLYTVSAA